MICIRDQEIKDRTLKAVRRHTSARQEERNKYDGWTWLSDLPVKPGSGRISGDGGFHGPLIDESRACAG